MPILNKNNKKEVNAIENVFTNKIFVLPERAVELEKMRTDESNNPAIPAPCTILGVNLSQDVERELREKSGLAVLNECITEEKEDKKKFSKLWKPTFLEKNNIGVVFIEFNSAHLDVTAKRTFALSILAQLPVLGIVRLKHAPIEEQAREYTGGTWPVFQLCEGGMHDVDDILAWLQNRLPYVRRITKSIFDDLMARCQDLGEINPAKHFIKRASVALIPFGVATVNFLGIVRLMAEMMVRSGMATDEEAKKAVKMIMAKGGAATAAIDSLGDIYQFAIVATVLSDGINNAVDAIMLGSTAVVTGTISAVGAYYSRPKIVRAAVEFLSSLQIVYLLNPTMRRYKSCVTGMWAHSSGYATDNSCTTSHGIPATNGISPAPSAAGVSYCTQGYPAVPYLVTNQGVHVMAQRPSSALGATQGSWAPGYSQGGGAAVQRPSSASAAGATQGSWTAGPPQVTWLGAPHVQPGLPIKPKPTSGYSATGAAHAVAHGRWESATPAAAPHGVNVTWLGAPQSQPVNASNVYPPASMQSSIGYPGGPPALHTISNVPSAGGVQGQWAPASTSYTAYNQGSWAPASGGPSRHTN